MFNRGVGKVQTDLKKNGNLPAEFNVNFITTFKVEVYVAFAINAGYGSCVPNWSGDSAVDRLNDTLRLGAAWIAYWVRLCVEVPFFTVVRFAELDRYFGV